MLRQALAYVFITSLFAACASPDRSTTSATNPTAPTPTPRPAPCISTACGSKTAQIIIPDAENILFTPDHRLFVSGGENVYEITQNPDASYTATPLAATNCNFTGLAQRGNTLYAACGDNSLYAADITGTPALSVIYTFTGIAGLANGMAIGPQGELYLADGPTGVQNPQIFQVKFDPNDPLAVISQDVWLSNTDGLVSPNGLAFSAVEGENRLYLTNSPQVQSVKINPDGSPGTLTTIATLPTIALDDLSLADDVLLVTDFTNSLVYRIALDGTIEQTSQPGDYASPSSVQRVQGPNFPENAVLITEKGVLGDTQSTVGNVLSLLVPN